jgi:hypothetical protein
MQTMTVTDKAFHEHGEMYDGTEKLNMLHVFGREKIIRSGWLCAFSTGISQH